jgi:carbohydrate kinase (thermoresistant glucokinase family)
MPSVPGLRSPYVKVGRLVFFGRMLDKIRLHAAGRLPPEYVSNLGNGSPFFADGRCCRFLQISYADVSAQAVANPDDLAVLAWAESVGVRPTDEECEVWNGYMMKLGWRDRLAPVLQRRIAQHGLTGRGGETMFDLMDLDEGRDPIAHRAWELRDPMIVVLMGVAGSGKTTIGTRLAADLGWSFRDADEFHPPENIARMSAGIPLTDADRAPWLAAIRAYAESQLARGESAVLTCSALREAYRHQLIGEDSRIRLVHLAGDYQLILARLNQRTEHFMKPEMLQSQFATLETPTSALTIDVAQPPDVIVREIRQAFSL